MKGRKIKWKNIRKTTRKRRELKRKNMAERNEEQTRVRRNTEAWKHSIGGGKYDFLISQHILLSRHLKRNRKHDITSVFYDTQRQGHREGRTHDNSSTRSELLARKCGIVGGKTRHSEAGVALQTCIVFQHVVCALQEAVNVKARAD